MKKTRQGVNYCFKFKSGWLKMRKGVSKDGKEIVFADIEGLGFAPMFEEFEDEKGEKHSSWSEGWAKPVTLAYDSYVGKWLKKNVEDIYKKEKDKEDSKWASSILESGYEFDSEGNLIENDKLREPVSAQLCVMASGDFRGILFLNVGSALDIYDSKTIVGDAKEAVMDLILSGAVYERRINLE